VSSTTNVAESLEAGRFIEAAGALTHIHEAGDGPPVLLLHGSGPGVSAWANWRLVLPELSRHAHVIAPDQLGFGRTARTADQRYGRSVWTEHAIAVIEELGLEDVAIIGNSMGGAVALSVAATRPDLISRLVLMGTCGVPVKLTPGLDAVWGYTPDRERMRRLIEIFAYDDTLASGDLVDMRYTQSMDPEARASYEAMFPEPRQRWLDDLALSDDELAAVDHRTLLIHGRDDEVIPLQASLTAFQSLANAELHCFAKCGHWVQIEQNRRFIDVVVDFLHTESS
jgi:2-hydroxymuconate-semialdehyde hydrolase